MSTNNNFEIIVTQRKTQLRNPSKKALMNNKGIGIIYNNKENIPIFFKRKDFEKIFNKIDSNSIIDLKLEDNIHKTVIKNYSFYPKNHLIEHVDFFKLPTIGKINIKIPIEWIGLPIGVAKGGLIRRFTNALLVSCDVNAVPTNFKINISSLDINMGLYLKDLNIAEEVTLIESPNKAIVSVIRTSKSKSTEETKESSTSEKDKKVSTDKKETPKKK